MIEIQYNDDDDDNNNNSSSSSSSSSRLVFFCVILLFWVICTISFRLYFKDNVRLLSNAAINTI